MSERYVWLNLETGEFSNSWTENEMNIAGGLDYLLEENKEDKSWKLIKFECLNDEDFTFSNLMRIR